MSNPSGTAPTPATSIWRQVRVERIAIFVLIGVALAAGVLVLGKEVGRHVHDFEAWIASLGAWAPAAFVLAYTLLSSIFVPDLLLGIVAGTTFGFTRGLAAVAAGTLGGATLQYALARRALKPAIDGLLASRPALAAIQAAVRQQELRLQLLIRLTPLNRALTSYLLGATGVGFARFAAACVALLPSLGLEVYAGHAGKHMVQMASHGGHPAVLHDVMLVAGLLVAMAAMVVVSRSARRALDAAAAASPHGQPGRPARDDAEWR